MSVLSKTESLKQFIEKYSDECKKTHPIDLYEKAKKNLRDYETITSVSTIDNPQPYIISPITNRKNSKSTKIQEIVKVCREIIKDFEKTNFFSCYTKPIIDTIKNNIDHISLRFEKTIKGYSIINESEITCAVWEDINCQLIDPYLLVVDQDKALGSHKSGIDNRFNNTRIANKTGLIKDNVLDISNYRLTNASRSITAMKNEITQRDASFDYYSILARKRNGDKIEYIWYMFPKDMEIFNPNHYE